MYTQEFNQYKQVVTEAYRQRQAAEPHLDWLVRPTRARIRQRCLELIGRGVEKRDEATLQNYLKMEPGDKDYEAAFNRKEAEDFKMLEKFFGDTGINTAEKNIELLAWLVEYPHRPFAVFRNRQEGVDQVPGKQPKMRPVDLPEEETEQPGQPASRLPQFRKTLTQRVPVKLIGALMVALVGGMFVWSSFGRDECMYWADDHYVASRCSAPKLDTPLRAMDRSRLKGFYRIKKTDTLTRYAVNRFWYARVADTIEIYSAGGRHPLYPDKKLKEVTDYIVNVCKNHH